MGEAQVSLEHLFRVFTKPEHKDSKLAQIEQHLSDNILDFLSQHVVTKKTSLEEIEKDLEINSKTDDIDIFTKDTDDTNNNSIYRFATQLYYSVFFILVIIEIIIILLYWCIVI